MIGRVQELFGKIRKRLLIKRCIQVVQFLVSRTYLLIHCRIFCIKSLDAFFSRVICSFKMLRLTATAYAAARACHDFNEIKVAELLFFKEMSHIRSSVDHRNTDSK